MQTSHGKKHLESIKLNQYFKPFGSSCFLCYRNTTSIHASKLQLCYTILPIHILSKAFCLLQVKVIGSRRFNLLIIFRTSYIKSVKEDNALRMPFSHIINMYITTCTFRNLRSRVTT